MVVFFQLKLNIIVQNHILIDMLQHDHIQYEYIQDILKKIIKIINQRFNFLVLTRKISENKIKRNNLFETFPMNMFITNFNSLKEFK